MEDLKVIESTLPVININFDEVNKALDETLTKYEGLVVTEETLKGCKTAQKELASLRTEVDNTRKSIKKKMSEPISKFEDMCKYLIEKIEKVEAPIKDGIKVFDDQKKEEKRKAAQIIIAEEVLLAELNEKYASMIELKDRYCNLTISAEEIRTDVKAQTLALQVQQKAEEDKINVILSAIESENQNLECKMQYQDFDYEVESGRSLSDILASIKMHARQIYKAEHPEEFAPKEEHKPDVKAEAEQPKEETKIETTEVKEEYFSVTFTITGNLEECRKVSAWLKDNKVNYKVVDQRRL